ncbi:oxidoreductase, aldo/keto reductase [Enterococcus phoeniculicola]|jgi:diketogulonate reductase-like aldo/keto reductase|uniref:Oxidoreductase, aldo/keto reductase n=1 Tax=Enterococcus phoeniculicola ATCC BAA-412 TaxID=1158610 RepID=R3W5Z9_9ENTE|nr:aldo/keto reductase [Enterococcus phoeniculicola]EOL43106.1 oxidoreductase, aldo/keto reductase [Enterococcus phoeniculicola ATCC BAA-412]EOT76536.1 oxidoreductase, aldo/keto reductase [Enterococcus phoeniculicola ATCC BAA-412]OJG72105.1 oxidoreductase, aldo/keto reductase [Enterococcus phoeniculicola]
MNSLTSTYKLSNGIEIPVVGFGTWQTPDGEVAVQSVKEALYAGYRHIDTAQGYGNEESVGRAISESGIPREDIFVTSKLGNGQHSYDLVMQSFEESLKKLQTDYLDLFLIHWPNPLGFRENWEQANADTWRAFEELYESGKIKAIGVSNFLPHHLETLSKTAKIMPMVNQIFLAPGELQESVVSYAHEHHMLLEAYSPLGTGKIFDVPEMKQLAETHKKSIAQVAIRWSLQHGFLPLPKSVTPSRIKENTQVFDFELSESEMATIDALDGVVGKAINPDTTQW